MGIRSNDLSIFDLRSFDFFYLKVDHDIHFVFLYCLIVVKLLSLEFGTKKINLTSGRMRMRGLRVWGGDKGSEGVGWGGEGTIVVVKLTE